MSTILVTGAGGFLGKVLCRMLLEEGHELRGFARGRYPELEAMGVDMRRGSLEDRDQVMEAVAGSELVYHVAAKAGVWGSYEDYYGCNVLGTQHIIEACLHHKVPRLVYTSTPSVTFAGQDEEGIDESTPYAPHFLNNYGRTKAMAEKMVLASNGDALATVALRPHLIWGPGDPHLVPRVIAKAKSGRLRLVGKEDKRVDITYVDNAARAHVLAGKALAPTSPCAGKAYFISNGEALPMNAVINRILAAAELAPITRRVPSTLAYGVGATLETLYDLFGISSEPPMTRFVARQLSTAHWYDITAAKRDLNYSPELSISEGFERLKAHLASNQ